MDIGTDVRGEHDTPLLTKAAADWQVRLLPAAAALEDGTFAIVPGHRFVVAGNTPVGQVGSRYHPVQNSELLGFARRTATALSSDIDRAGVTQGHRRFWCHIPVGSAGLLLSTKHDGRGAVSAQMVASTDSGIIRIGPESTSTLSFPHGPTLQARLDDPAEVAGWANNWELRLRGHRELLAAARVPAELLGPALDGVVPAEKATTDRKVANRHAVMDIVAHHWVNESDGRMDGWTLLSAISWYLDRRRRATPADRADQAVDDSGWVTRAKYLAHSVVVTHTGAGQ